METHMNKNTNTTPNNEKNVKTDHENKNQYFHGETNKTKKKNRRMLAFHNYLKDTLYQRYVPHHKGRILELAAGRGGDICKIISSGAEYALLIEKNKEALDEAKKRFDEADASAIKIRFLEYDLSKNATKDIGRIIEKNGIDCFDIISIQFAFHYFLESKQSFETIFKNIDTYCCQDGYVFITGFDGERVINYLKEIRKGEGKALMVNDIKVFEIYKLYNSDELRNTGQSIDVFIQTIGKHKEYLINFNFVIKYFEKHGYQLVENKYFNKLIRDWRAHIKKKIFLNPSEFTFSSLNRVVVLRKIKNKK